MKDDVLMMKRLGLNAYRFSIAWGADPSRTAGAP